MSLQIANLLHGDTLTSPSDWGPIENTRQVKSEPEFFKPTDVFTANECDTVSLPSFDPTVKHPVFHSYQFYEETEFYNRLQSLEENPEFAADVSRIRKSSKSVENCDAGDFNAATRHPACLGYKLLKDVIPSTTSYFEEITSPKTCPAKEFVETYIFPILLPALEKMLEEARNQNVFERRRTKFNGCDFLTEYLYRHNPAYSDRTETDLWDIPFVQRILAEKPRPPLPLSLLLTEEEAAVMIQSFWRGYQARKDPEIQELRQYQQEMREEEYDITFRVSEFWRRHPVEEPDDDGSDKVDTVNTGGSSEAANGKDFVDNQR